MNKAVDNFVVWSEIPVTDLKRGKAFYGKVFGVSFMDETDGPKEMSTMIRGAHAGNPGGVSGHLYKGTPAPRHTGSTIHLVVSGKLEDTMALVEPAGGKLVSPAIEIPPGRFAYCFDPDGNSIGLFEPRG